MASSPLPYSQGRPPANFPGRIGGSRQIPVSGFTNGHYAPPPPGLVAGPVSVSRENQGGVTQPPQQYNPTLPHSIAGAFVQGQANNGAPWARQLQNSPWAGHGPNTQAGWQAAGYGNRSSGGLAVQPGETPANHADHMATPAPDPRDSAYYANVAANQFKINNQQNAIGEQGGYAAVDLQNALAKLAYQQPRDELKAEQAANNRGGLYSSVYNQQLGDLAHAYQENNFSAQQAFDRGSAARAAQSKALDESVPLYNAQQYAGATIRAANQASQDKSLGESGKPLVPGHHPHGKSNTQRLAATIAGRFVQGQAHNGASWARKLSKSPWATGQNNTAAGWKAAGYGR